MTIRRDPSTLHGAVEAAVTDAGGYAVAADIIAKPEKWLRDVTNPTRDPAKAGQLTYAHARALTRAGVLALAQDLAALAGMSLVPMEESDVSTAEVMAATAAVMGAAADAASVGALAFIDGEIDAREREQLIDRATVVEQAARRLKAQLGKGGGG